MIDLNDFRSRPEAYQKACDDKRIAFDVDKFIELDTKWKSLTTATEELRAKQKRLSKELPSLKGDEQSKMREELKSLSDQVKQSNAELSEVETAWKREQLRIPSIPLDSVPIGKDDTENKLLSTWGDIPKFSFPVKDHLDIGTDLDIIDVERGVKIAGARNYFLKGDGARLQHAVLSFAMDFIRERQYTLLDPPHIVNYDAMMGTGYFPGGEEMAYHLDERDADSYLIGTSEVALVSYHSGEIFPKGSLPKKYAGFSPCYRREAGSYGKDTRGLYRVHQFFKVEQVIFCEADDEISRSFHEELLENSEKFTQLLGLPYRVVEVCTGDLGQGQLYKNDIEVWMPSREAYSETHSCSTMHDFQARRLKIRYKNEEGASTICHTLNNTLIASPRVLIPLLEMNQNEDGSVSIPEVLRPYMGGQEKIVKPA
jgi:seryl-tRNA synthetase